MANKRFSTVKRLVFILCLFAGAASLFAQSFSQTLKWNGDQNVLEYKVEIKNSKGTTIKTITTESSSVNLSLGPGKYRYKITAYDLLGRESVSTKWTDFEVLRANQPAIEHKETLESLQEDGKTLEMDLNVTDVTSDTVAELVNQKSGKKIRGKLILSGTTGANAGSAGSETYKASKVSFENVPEGNWKLVITNPSGLSTESESFEVKDIYKEKKAAAEKAEKERLAREKKEREEAERIAKEKAAKEEAERKIREEAERIERERIAAIEAARAEEERKQREELQKILEQVEKEKQAKLEEEKKAREEIIQQMVKKEEEERRIVQEKKEHEEAEKRAIEQAAREEEERIKREEELALAEEERLAREEAEAAEREEKKRLRREKWLTYDRKFNLTVGIGAAFNVMDNDFKNVYVNNTSMNPTLNAKLGFLPVHTKNGRVRFGMEFNGMATKFENTNEYYSLNFELLALQDNMSLRFGNKSKKMWLQLNGGGGVAIMKEILDYTENTEENKKDKTIYYGYFTAGGGLSVIFTPSSTFRMEIGADYYNLFIPEMNLGIVNPYIGIGIRL